MTGWAAGLLAMVGLLATSRAQPREFWAVDFQTGELALVAPGQPPSGVLPVPGWARQVRCDLSGRGVVIEILAPRIHLVDAAGVLRPVLLPGDPADAAPDGQGGAWVVRGDAGGARIDRVSSAGVVTEVVSLADAARHLVPVPGGLVLARRVRDTGIAALVLLRTDPGNVADELLLPDLPTEIVLDQGGRVLLAGLGIPFLPAVRVSGQRLIVDEMIPLPAPCSRVRPVGAAALLVLDAGAGGLRFVPPQASPYPTIPLEGVTALEELPNGAVLVKTAATGEAAEVHVDGIRWRGPWRFGRPDSDGPGRQWGHARPREDPDGDGFPTADETRVGTDPGSPLSAPFVAWRAGDRLHLRTVGSGALVYAVAAGTAVVPGTTLLAPGPLLFQSLVPGALFDRPVGFLDVGGVDVYRTGPIPAGALVACAAFDAVTVAPVHAPPPRPWSAW